MFRDGQYVEQNYAEAVRFYRLAAEQGDAEGQANLGYMFFQGTGTAKDYAEAVRLLRLAEAQGHTSAQCSLGIWLKSICPNLARDPAEGVSWMRIAATNGNARAQLVMGYTSEPVDREEAIRWFSLAAAQGCTEGADGLRRCRV
jgi:TPR repeat protein